MTGILPIFCASLIIASTDGSTASNFHKLPNFDMDQPSCKYVISSIVDIDNQFFGLLTLWFPPLSVFAKKYLKTIEKRDVAVQEQPDRFRRSLITDVMGLMMSKAPKKLIGLAKAQFVADVIDKGQKLYRHLNNCSLWAKDYFDYWRGMVGVILNEQGPIFLGGF
ncbi:uncharacterized protein LOC109536228 [Dendroctonus ponderosae]|uniref:Uncharacterized protein n=1 Tax=Dendroctonus ponderosae TaxID=77166 RepID=U4U3L5_DENPD|nr:uncharacterized protein LOC109536228 [Dendroctonus ponderosae]ERL88479.1 hypothetical protein D910_05865 [Dendroctonus ponderosae]KAH1026077.1 hypothetical protein HUJ05_010665 [Dendroctonus ponderosae]